MLHTGLDIHKRYSVAVTLGNRGKRLRLRTRVRNRIHALLDRHPDLERPQFKDVFCKKGVAWMRRVTMPEPDRSLLNEELSLLSLLADQIRELEERIETYDGEDVLAVRLRTLPGVGPILARRMATIAWQMLKAQRDYQDQPPICALQEISPAALVAD